MRILLFGVIFYLISFASFGQDFRLWGATIAGGKGYGTIYSLRPNDSQLIVAKEFTGNPKGSNPQGGLILGSDGNLYGINTFGGVNRNGTIYSIKTDGTGFKVLYSFDGISGSNPTSSLYQSADGELFGHTVYGGTNGTGTLFKIKTDGTGFKKLIDFTGSNGFYPQSSVIQATDGFIYGVVGQGGNGGNGIIYKIKTDGTGFQKLMNFDGANTGSIPEGYLLQAADGKLYGTTTSGGANGMGVLYKINTDGSQYTKLLNFGGGIGEFPGNGLVQASDGKLYGMTGNGGAGGGVVFKVNTDGSGFTVVLNFNGITGNQPYGRLIINTSGKLVGMTSSYGVYGFGTVFSINTNGTGFTKLLDFDGSNGANPLDNNVVQGPGGDYFGVTRDGGAGNQGVIFKLTESGTYSKLMEYGSEGSLVLAGLTRASDGNLYGVSTSGGLYGYGTIFRIKPDGTGFTTLYDFSVKSGGNITGRLFEASDGKLYGTTSPGIGSYGNIFAIQKDGSGYIVLHNFDVAGGFNSAATFMQMSGGELLGTASQGGANDGGVLFKMALDGSGYTVLYNFTSGSEANEIMKGADGNIYGTCQSGGAGGYGIIYKINPNGTGFTKLHDFLGISDGINPVGLTQLPDGTLVGITRFVVGGGGTLFEMKTDGTGYKNVINFFGPNGRIPNAGRLILAPDGYLYGAAYGGGINEGGTVFRIKADRTDFSVVYHLDASSGTYPYTADLVLIPTLSQSMSSFVTLTDKTVGDAPFLLSATSTSSLPAEFISSKAILTINGNVATIVAAGKVTISATQPGNLEYSNAAPLTQTICIRPAKPVITTTGGQLTSSNLQGNQWFRNGTPIPGAINSTYSVVSNGVYTVQSTVDGCVSDVSSSKDIANVVTGDLTTTIEEGIRLYPNPAKDMLTISVANFDKAEPSTFAILDMNGRAIEEVTVTGQELNFKVTHLITGMYVVKASQNGQVFRAKFLKE